MYFYKETNLGSLENSGPLERDSKESSAQVSDAARESAASLMTAINDPSLKESIAISKAILADNLTLSSSVKETPLDKAKSQLSFYRSYIPSVLKLWAKLFPDKETASQISQSQNYKDIEEIFTSAPNTSETQLTSKTQPELDTLLIKLETQMLKLIVPKIIEIRKKDHQSFRALSLALFKRKFDLNTTKLKSSEIKRKLREFKTDANRKWNTYSLKEETQLTFKYLAAQKKLQTILKNPTHPLAKLSLYDYPNLYEDTFQLLFDEVSDDEINEIRNGQKTNFIERYTLNQLMHSGALSTRELFKAIPIEGEYSDLADNLDASFGKGLELDDDNDQFKWGIAQEISLLSATGGTMLLGSHLIQKLPWLGKFFGRMGEGYRKIEGTRKLAWTSSRAGALLGETLAFHNIYSGYEGILDDRPFTESFSAKQTIEAYTGSAAFISMFKGLGAYGRRLVEKRIKVDETKVKSVKTNFLIQHAPMAGGMFATDLVNQGYFEGNGFHIPFTNSSEIDQVSYTQSALKGLMVAYSLAGIHLAAEKGYEKIITNPKTEGLIRDINKTEKHPQTRQQTFETVYEAYQELIPEFAEISLELPNSSFIGRRIELIQKVESKLEAKDYKPTAEINTLYDHLQSQIHALRLNGQKQVYFTEAELKQLEAIPKGSRTAETENLINLNRAHQFMEAQKISEPTDIDVRIAEIKAKEIHTNATTKETIETTNLDATSQYLIRRNTRLLETTNKFQELQVAKKNLTNSETELDSALSTNIDGTTIADKLIAAGKKSNKKDVNAEAVTHLQTIKESTADTTIKDAYELIIEHITNQITIRDKANTDIPTLESIKVYNESNTQVDLSSISSIDPIQTALTETQAELRLLQELSLLESIKKTGLNKNFSSQKTTLRTSPLNTPITTTNTALKTKIESIDKQFESERTFIDHHQTLIEILKDSNLSAADIEPIIDAQISQLLSKATYLSPETLECLKAVQAEKTTTLLDKTIELQESISQLQKDIIEFDSDTGTKTEEDIETSIKAINTKLKAIDPRSTFEYTLENIDTLFERTPLNKGSISADLRIQLRQIDNLRKVRAYRNPKQSTEEEDFKVSLLPKINREAIQKLKATLQDPNGNFIKIQSYEAFQLGLILVLHDPEFHADNFRKLLIAVAKQMPDDQLDSVLELIKKFTFIIDNFTLTEDQALAINQSSSNVKFKETISNLFIQNNLTTEDIDPLGAEAYLENPNMILRLYQQIPNMDYNDASNYYDAIKQVVSNSSYTGVGVENQSHEITDFSDAGILLKQLYYQKISQTDSTFEALMSKIDPNDLKFLQVPTLVKLLNKHPDLIIHLKDRDLQIKILNAISQNASNIKALEAIPAKPYYIGFANILQSLTQIDNLKNRAKRATELRDTIYNLYVER